MKQPARHGWPKGSSSSTANGFAGTVSSCRLRHSQNTPRRSDEGLGQAQRPAPLATHCPTCKRKLPKAKPTDYEKAVAKAEARINANLRKPMPRMVYKAEAA